MRHFTGGFSAFCARSAFRSGGCRPSPGASNSIRAHGSWSRSRETPGLARIHGMGIGGKTWEEVERLKALEAQAKAEKRGAWGMAKS